MQGQLLSVFVAHAFVLLSAQAHGVAEAAAAKFAADVAVFVVTSEGPCAAHPESGTYCPKVGAVRRLRRRTPLPIALPNRGFKGTAPAMARLPSPAA